MSFELLTCCTILILLFIVTLSRAYLVKWRIRRHINHRGGKVLSITRFHQGLGSSSGPVDLFTASQRRESYYYVVAFIDETGVERTAMCKTSLTGSFAWVEDPDQRRF